MSMPNSVSNRPPARPPRQVLTDGVYEAVKERLMNLTIEPGSLLNMAQLARELEVSTTPLREALARLESEGLLVMRPLQGYRATAVLDTKGLSDLFQVRLALEPVAASAAATQRGPAQLADLDASIAAMNRITADTPPTGEYQHYRTFADEDARFHGLVAEASGNPLLARTIAGLHAHVHLYRLFFTGGIAPETAREHQLVHDAISRGDAAAATKAMRLHLDNSWKRLRTKK